MPIIHYLPDKQDVESKNNATILETSLEAKIPHVHVCGGYARCTTCRVLILEGLRHCLPRNDDEERIAKRLHFSPDIRLACQTRISGDIRLRRLVLDKKDIHLDSQLDPDAVVGPVGHEQEVGILVANLNGFDAFTEKNLAYDVIHILNRYFYEMSQVVHRHGGHVISFLSEGIIAVFGIEHDQQTAIRTVKAGLEMLKVMEQLSFQDSTIYRANLDIHTGIHYGKAVIGMVGVDSRKSHTAIGQAVNLAGRIGAANKDHGTKLLISDAVYRQVQTVVRTGKEVRLTLPETEREQSLYEVTGMDKTLILEPVEAPEPVSFQAPAQPDRSKDWVIALGGLLLGIFIVGFFSSLGANNALLILIYTILGLTGGSLLVWRLFIS